MKIKLLLLLIILNISIQIKPDSINNIITNNDNIDNTVSSAKAFGNNKYTAPIGVAMKTPEIVDNINNTTIFPPDSSHYETIEELPSKQEYYNGDIKLNKIVINCKIYINEFDCLHTSYCGWCSQPGVCIGGGLNGPYEPCDNGEFIFGNSLINKRKQLIKSYGLTNRPIINKTVLSNNLRGTNTLV